MEHKKYWCPTHSEVQSDDSNAICIKCGTMVLISNPNHENGSEEVIQILKVKRSFKEFLPLIYMVAVVVALTIVFDIVFQAENFTHTMRHFMSSFFLVFGLLKVSKLKDFAIAYREYDIVAKKSMFYAKMYPFLELAFALAYLINWNPILTNVIVLVVMSISAIGVYLKVRKGEQIPCACLGTVFKVPMTWVTLVEDLLMAGMALYMIII
jgi:hypothetical protein